MGKRKREPEPDTARFDVTVWDMRDGDIVKKLWDATWDEVQEVHQRFDNEPFHEIQVEER